MADDPKVRVMSEEEKESYQGETINESGQQEQPRTDYQSGRSYEIPHQRHYEIHDAGDYLKPGNIFRYLWKNTSWKTKGIALVAIVAAFSALSFVLTVALPFLLTVVGAAFIFWFVLSFFMQH